MHENVWHDAFEVVKAFLISIPGVAALSGAIGWASFRMMNPKELSPRRFFGGIIFAGFVGWVCGTLLMEHLGPSQAAAVGGALGSVGEKVRSLWVQWLIEKTKGDSK